MTGRYRATATDGWECVDCGGLIWDTDRHDRFHAALQDLERLASGLRPIGTARAQVDDRPRRRVHSGDDWPVLTSFGEDEPVTFVFPDRT